ncbi:MULTISPECIES: hypothetical protein [Bacillus]|uniref:hypothetical protein n=1 Tax=Bacillus TaxID=1386 RepID=UPI0006564FF2|nr:MULTISPECIES: hypothetical protein [Bacillus]AKN14809.1 hypothetical protein ABU16_3733 [Bacillus subtilis]MCH4866935.1 hypothetical protein [Bacillus sp. 1006-3]MCJ2152674.1 hypothetical protein [Bacillus subtilis]MCR4381241.1 hypothetical protein [Bacillus subtilis]WKB61906.1 hypothetical protein QYC34_15670 [Bacillus subtilis]
MDELFLISHVWQKNKFHLVVSESKLTHEKALDKLLSQGGKVIRNERADNLLGTVIVNGKRSVWPLTKAEAIEQGSEN